jgi:transposase-like protein
VPTATGGNFGGVGVASDSNFKDIYTNLQYRFNLERDKESRNAIKRRVNAKQGFREFQAARRTIQGYEAIHMIRKGQVRWVAGDDLLRQIQFIDNLFDLAA